MSYFASLVTWKQWWFVCAVWPLVCRQLFSHLALQWADQRNGIGLATRPTRRMIVLIPSSPQPLHCCLLLCFSVSSSTAESFEKQGKVGWPHHYRRWYRPLQCRRIAIPLLPLTQHLAQTNCLYRVCRLSILTIFIFYFLYNCMWSIISLSSWVFNAWGFRSLSHLVQSPGLLQFCSYYSVMTVVIVVSQCAHSEWTVRLIG